MNLKYGKDSYIEINKNINKLLNVKIDKSLLSKKDIETNINIKMSFLSSDNNLFKTMKYLISIDNNIRFILQLRTKASFVKYKTLNNEI